MKKFKFLYYILAVSFLMGCGSDDDATALEDTLLADFSFTNDGSVFTFTNLSEGATTYQWDFGDLNFYGHDENPVYTYQIGGELVVSLTITDDSGETGFVSKIITAPEIIIINIEIDGDFEDWENVEYVAAAGSGSLQKMKIWTGGSDINIYLEGDTTMQMELIDMFINSDGDTSTGFIHWAYDGSGADYLFEGPVVFAGWGSFYAHDDPSGDWGWAAIAGSSGNLIPSEVVSISADQNAIEFRIPKTFLAPLGDTIGIAIQELNSGWSAIGSFPEEGAAFVTAEF